MFHNPFPNAFGLDIDDLSIKIVQLQNMSWQRRRRSFDVVNYRSTKLPHGLIMNGEMVQPEAVRKYLKHLLGKKSHKEKAIKSPWVVASLPDTQAFLKLIEVDKDPEDIIEEDVLYTAKKHIPFEEDAYYLDWQLMPNEGKRNKSSVLIGAVPKSIADMYTYLLESLGLIVVALEIDALAVARTMITADKKYENEARALLDLGATRATLTIYDNGHIQFSNSLPFSGEIMTTAIAQKLHISYEDAEALKKEHGLRYKKNNIWGVMVESVEDLVVQIKKAIDFYYSHFQNTNKITHITMCGGASAMEDLDTILSLKLGITAEPGKVWKNLNTKKPIHASEEESLGFATALGLALRATDNPFINKYRL